MKRPSIVFWTIAKVAIVLLFGGWCALFLRRFDLYFPFVPPTSGRPFGIALMMLGGFLVLTCGAILSTRGIGARGDRLFPKEFVAFGPFRYVRNPMSLGAVTLLCGLGLLERSLTLLLFTVLLLFLLHVVVVLVEEPGLEKRFGNSYRSYKQSVNRWLPSYRKRRSTHPTG
jgi:protein-S-isoprenylcysteine O-methyltransferase Ste14